MDSWEWNKIAGAVLGTLMFVLVLNIAIGKIFEVPEPAKPGYIVAGVPAVSTEWWFSFKEHGLLGKA